MGSERAIAAMAGVASVRRLIAGSTAADVSEYQAIRSGRARASRSLSRCSMRSSAAPDLVDFHGGGDRHLQLAPHSYTTVVSSDPPVVAFISIGRKDTFATSRRRVFRLQHRKPGAGRADQSDGGRLPARCQRVRLGRIDANSEHENSRRRGCRRRRCRWRRALIGVQRVLETENFIVMGQRRCISYRRGALQGDRVATAPTGPCGSVGRDTLRGDGRGVQPRATHISRAARSWRTANGADQAVAEPGAGSKSWNRSNSAWW